MWEIIRYKAYRNCRTLKNEQEVIKFHLTLLYLKASSSFISVEPRGSIRKFLFCGKWEEISRCKPKETILFVVHVNTLSRNNIFAVVFLECANSTYISNTCACLVSRLNKSHLNKMVLMQAICLWGRAFILLFVQLLRDPVSQSKSSWHALHI